jgi:hypothetical protein
MTANGWRRCGAESGQAGNASVRRPQLDRDPEPWNRGTSAIRHNPSPGMIAIEISGFSG